MEGCMDHIHLAIKVSNQKASLAYRLLVAVPAKVTNTMIKSTLDMEWSDTRSLTAFSSIVLSLRKDIHH
jgi:hypothetical protein